MPLSVPKERLQELFDEPEHLAVKVHLSHVNPLSPVILAKQVTQLASDIKRAHQQGKPIVFFTGAGLSTAADIPDYRGPNGVWTRRDQGLPKLKTRGLEGASPTYAHRVIAYMLKHKLADYIVSQNVDCLHLKSGVPESQLAELHGNSFKETCSDCGKSYLRDFSVRKRKGPLFKSVRDKTKISHITGRACEPCQKKGKRGMLRDSVIHFGEDLPDDAFDNAEKWCSNAGVVICMGTSLHVSPACDLPEMCAEADGKMYIINLQRTDHDHKARSTGGQVIHAKCDKIMYMIAQQLGIDCGDPPKEKQQAEEDKPLASAPSAAETNARVAAATKTQGAKRTSKAKTTPHASTAKASNAKASNAKASNAKRSSTKPRSTSTAVDKSRSKGNVSKSTAPTQSARKTTGLSAAQLEKAAFSVKSLSMGLDSLE